MSSTYSPQPITPLPVTVLSARRDTDRLVLADIFEPHVNICGWQRNLAPAMSSYLSTVLDHSPRLTQVLSVDDAGDYLSCRLPEGDGRSLFIDDIIELIDMLTCLLDCQQVGMRLTVLDRAMCPKFHRDNLQVRLVTTYKGPGTEWLPEPANSDDDIQRAQTAEVVLLKGDAWPNNQGRGALHRSPALPRGEKRLVVTLDPM
jgi:hypothetical protein